MVFFTKRAEEKSTDKLINEFLNKSEGLQRILEKETEYFRDMKTKQATMLVETKFDLVDELEALKTSLIENPSYLQTLPEAEKQKLKAANDSLMQAAEENYHETLKAKEVNQLIMEAISEAVAQQGRVDGAYGDKGAAYGNNYDARPIAVVHNA